MHVIIQKIKRKLDDNKRKKEKMKRAAEKEAARQAKIDKKNSHISNYSSNFVLGLEGNGTSIKLADAPVNRNVVRKTGSRTDKTFYHMLARQTHAELIAERIRMGREYLATHGTTEMAHIDPVTGFGSMALPDDPISKAGYDEARAFVDAVPQEALESSDKNAMVFVVSAEEKLNLGDNRIDYDSAIRALATSPTILAPVIEYLGMMPILFSATVNISPNRAMEENSSQHWHYDPEDITQVKVFIYLDDIDENSGPFTALPATEMVKLEALHPDYGKGRVPDEDVIAACGPDAAKAFTGPAGTAVFCDTTRCLHFGSRPGHKARPILFLMYALPTSTWYPLCEGDGTAFHYIERFQDPRATEVERALLGMDLTPK